MKLLWLPDHLRDWGLEPIEVDGWRTRGYGSFDTFKPSGFVDHHTAGGQGWAPSLGIVIHGRSDLPGPLAQLFTPRNPKGKRNVHVVAAGRANHAGKGGWLDMAGNGSVVGHERENVGTKAEPWQPWQTEDAAVVAACILDGLGRYEHVTTNAGRYCEHKEWAPTRKSDAHTVIGDDMRRRVRAAQPGTPQEDEMTDEQRDYIIRAVVDQVSAKVMGEVVARIDNDIRPALDRLEAGAGGGGASADAIADALAARLKD